MSRYIAITDIHGELGKLENVLSKIELRANDTFVFLGDYIDRGNENAETLKFLYSIAEKAEAH